MDPFLQSNLTAGVPIPCGDDTDTRSDFSTCVLPEDHFEIRVDLVHSGRGGPDMCCASVLAVVLMPR
jgi:hypothetical protein